MKKLRTFLSVGLLALLTACGTTKNSTAENQATNRGRANTEVISSGNSVSGSRPKTENRTAATITTSTDVENKAAMEQMYSYLNMSDDQISRFDRGWKSTTDTWKKANPNKSMNSFERTETQDKILKDILDESQFEKYQQWARENAESNK
ncbi:hypothetical protein [Aequorivita sp. CIP111184]|uniref:hypothetical protein n=1 Tax=Aequorivita sp. CIP111184 TaxID=2211356 RepID=UPI0011BE24DE|nr:hypothetical protein [Aequorivita sp. CIP111184]